MTTTSIQLWPAGKSVSYSGEEWNPEGFTIHEGETTRKGTPEENRQIQINILANRYLDQEVLCCDSSLVSELLQNEFDGFTIDDINQNQPDVDEWDFEDCRDYLKSEGVGTPIPDPYDMTKEECEDSLGIDEDDDESTDDLEELRRMVIESMDAGTIDGIEEWREACRDHMNDNPREAYEWWRVSSWLCKELAEIGEITIDNGYGCWWGRTCTGQNMIMDGTLQEVAARHVT